MQVIYIEKAIKEHPRVAEICQRYGNNKKIILCNHYGEIFNRRNQNFRIQKQQPALILAEKKGRKVLPAPEGFGIGGAANYYFSHMQNCLYDCRYCFLQGMYPSAHYLLFVNFEGFFTEIEQVIAQHKRDEALTFFSGYDCDSLAFEPVSRFVEHFLPFFANHPQASLELRTKSTNIRPLLQHEVIPNCIVAFSLTPELLAKQVEHKVPPLAKRLLALQQVSQAGWQIGLRFDPLIMHPQFELLYCELIAEVFRVIDQRNLHSVSVGPLRFPQKMYAQLVELYPKEPLLAGPLVKRNKLYSYGETEEQVMTQLVLNELARYTDQAKLFQCHVL